MNTALTTEVEFELPKGYLDEDGDLHRKGTMRLATAADEILPLKDLRVKSNPAYLGVIVLSRVVNRIGSVTGVTPKVIEGLFAADLAYLQALYDELNGGGSLQAEAACPKCEHTFTVAVDLGVEA